LTAPTHTEAKEAEFIQNTVKLASIFSDHAVLQREIEIPVWGWANPGSRVTVELAGKSASATTSADGKWRANLPPLSAGGPHTLTVCTSGETDLKIHDVLIGEVWLCSGQSNMEFTLSDVNDGKAEVAAANHPMIRLFNVPKRAKIHAQDDVDTEWELCTPESASGFSAVGYFHGLELQQRLGVPIGLIDSSYGGTKAEQWTSRAGLAAEPTLQSFIAEYDRLTETDPATVEALRQELAEWKQTYLNRPFPRNIGLEQGWAKLDEPSDEWKPIAVPGHWQSAGLNFNGVVWYRREIDIPANWAGQDLSLSIGSCDKSDWTYFNGELVGSLTHKDSAYAWCTPRVYTVPGRLVRAGKNVITVRVFSHLFDGGMTGPVDLMFIKQKSAEQSEMISLAEQWNYRVAHNFGVAPHQPPGPTGRSTPCTLYNGMIAPLVPYALRGAIWYQGESNTTRPQQYQTLFPAMIRNWRQDWGQENFHFHFVQLANFMSPPTEPGESQWAELREAQTMALSLPDTGMAVIIDLGEETDIHPRNKQDVGHRLAVSVLSKVYELADVIPSGPLYKTHSIEGAHIRLWFDYVAGGLIARNGVLKTFAIAGADQKFHWANAQIEGDTIVVSSPEVLAPVSVRYGWADNPACNLYNTAGLPASPFRTDRGGQ
jgi:sialate O-acetylesterase